MPGKLTEMIEAGKRRVEKKFSMAAFAERLDRLVQSIDGYGY